MQAPEELAGQLRGSTGTPIGSLSSSLQGPAPASSGGKGKVFGLPVPKGSAKDSMKKPLLAPPITIPAAVPPMPLPEPVYSATHSSTYSPLTPKTIPGLVAALDNLTADKLKTPLVVLTLAELLEQEDPPQEKTPRNAPLPSTSLPPSQLVLLREESIRDAG